MSDARPLELSHLGNGCPGLTPSYCETLAEAGAVCLHEQQHLSGKTLLQVRSHFEGALVLSWPPVTSQMLACYNDPDQATEWGACGIAILLVRELYGFTVVKRARRGTGFDYWLGRADGHLFQDQARLEVSGIRSGFEAAVQARMRDKIAQMRRAPGLLPAYAVVVEFGQPRAEVQVDAAS